MQVLHATGEQPRRHRRAPLGAGSTDESFALASGGVAWFGRQPTPSGPTGVASLQFIAAPRKPATTSPDVFGAEPSNMFAGRNVTAIALQLPNSAFGGSADQPVGPHQPLRPRRTEAGQPVRQPDGAAAVLPHTGSRRRSAERRFAGRRYRESCRRLEQVARSSRRCGDFVDPAAQHAAVVRRVSCPTS